MATFTVTGTQDSGEGSLRAAVLAANAAAGPDDIVFSSAFDGGAEDVIRLTTGQIEITDGLTITGGPASVTITGDANGDDIVGAGAVTDVAASLDGEDRLNDNSRIFDATADLTIDGLTLTGGRTTGDRESGGAVRGSWSVTLTNSTVTGNSTAGDFSEGGGVSGFYVALTNTTVTGNSTSGKVSDGGGVYGGDEWGGGGVTITGSTVSGNSTLGDYSEGGGIRGFYVALTMTTVCDNSTSGNVSHGGGVCGGRIFDGAGGVTIENSTISGNSTAGVAAEGGGVWGMGVGMRNSTVTDNGTLGDSSAGGGVWGLGITTTNSTISKNSTTGETSGGGGLYSRNASLVLINSTVSGNITSGNRSEGGGLVAYGYGSPAVELTNSIVLGNATIFAGVGTDETATGTVLLTGGNILGTTLFDGADIRDVTAAEVFAATTEIAPGVFAGVLADNGGPTQTIAIRPDGPAAGAADPATATETDQRGVARDDAPDLGAFEAGAEGGLKLVGGPGADVLVGGAGDNRICGRGGNDTLRGLAGDDLLRGGKGCDRLKGGAGEDDLAGGRGRDRIGGGTGDDTLGGGEGRDVFVFGRDFGDDEIRDFDATPRCGQDRIDLRALGISAASFAEAVSIERRGDDTLVAIAEQGSILCLGVDGEGANRITQADFLFLG